MMAYMKPFKFTCTLLVALLCLGASGCIAVEERASVEAETLPLDAASERVEMQRIDGTLEVDIHSERGIGETTLSLGDSARPNAVVLRLHLAGLEHLRLTTADTTISASVASMPQAAARDVAVQQELTSASDSASAQSLDASHPLWLTISPPSAAHAYFTVDLPPALLSSTATLDVEWIDFYR